MKIYFADSFTNEPFKGNPAAVCFPDTTIETAKMLMIAKEIGFSETAFLEKTVAQNTYNIRYFSPRKEIPLCGHATLASAKVLFDKYGLTDIAFITVENTILKVRKAGGAIVMSFPVYDTTVLTVPVAITDALGIKETVQTSFSSINKIVILEIADAGILAALKPDFNALLNSYEGINGVLVTAPSNTGEFDFQYRYFWPWAGTNEDPVTGGVQTFLTKYWSLKLNKRKLRSFQSSERTGFMTTELQGNEVLVYGNAIIILEGELTL